jgi:toxin HigB-1
VGARRRHGSEESLANRTIYRYAYFVIKSFKNRLTDDLYQGLSPRAVHVDVAKRAIQKLFLIDTVTRLEDLRVPPGNRLEALKGNRSGQHSIRVNDQWRICFVWKDGEVHDVEFCDYH